MYLLDTYKNVLPRDHRTEQIQIPFRAAGATITAVSLKFQFGNNDTFLTRKVSGIRLLHPTLYPVLSNGHNNVPAAIFQRCFLNLAWQQNYYLREISLISISRIQAEANDTVIWFEEPVNITTNDSGIVFRPEGGYVVPAQPADSIGESFGLEVFYVC